MLDRDGKESSSLACAALMDELGHLVTSRQVGTWCTTFQLAHAHRQQAYRCCCCMVDLLECAYDRTCEMSIVKSYLTVIKQVLALRFSNGSYACQLLVTPGATLIPVFRTKDA